MNLETTWSCALVTFLAPLRCPWLGWGEGGTESTVVLCEAKQESQCRRPVPPAPTPPPHGPPAASTCVMDGPEVAAGEKQVV